MSVHQSLHKTVYWCTTTLLWYQNPFAIMSYSIFTQPTRESLQWNNAQGLLSTGLLCCIQETRNRHVECNCNVPSQAATPPKPSTPPSTSFDKIFADFFDYSGHHYLIVGDHLSGWVEVLSSTSGTNLGGSAGLVRHLRKFFTTFSVLEELWSDGGP